MSSSRKTTAHNLDRNPGSQQNSQPRRVRGWTWQDSYLVSALVSSFPGEVGKDTLKDSLIKELDNSRVRKDFGG